jgi:hypothetical protein
VTAAQLLAAAQDDPVLAHQVERAQHQAYAALVALVDDATALLSQRLGAATPPRPEDGPIDVLALRAMSRQRQTEAQCRRDVVEAFVLGALINHDNPGWNPLDPATSRKAEDSALGALLLAGVNENR